VLPGAPGDLPAGFSGDGASIFVIERAAFPHPVAKLDVATGARTPWATIDPPDRDLTPDDDARFLSDADGDLFYSVVAPQSELLVIEPPASR